MCVSPKSLNFISFGGKLNKSVGYNSSRLYHNIDIKVLIKIFVANLKIYYKLDADIGDTHDIPICLRIFEKARAYLKSE